MLLARVIDVKLNLCHCHCHHELQLVWTKDKKDTTTSIFNFFMLARLLMN